MSNEKPDYLAYLLRLWKEEGKGQNAWRASLQRSRTAKRRVFANLDDLFAYLQRQMGVALDADGGNNEAAREC
jgi:hypothetical protein